MSLLDDLQNLDLSAIVNARGSITASFNAPELQSILSGGAVQTTLGGLGTAIALLQSDFSDPKQMLRPLMDGVSSVTASFTTDDIPLADYLAAVRAGVEILVRLFEGLGDNPANFGSILGGQSFGNVLDLAKDAVKGLEPSSLEGLSHIRDLIDSVDRGLPTNPQAIAEFALEIFLPFPKEPLTQIRASVDAVLNGAVNIALPSTRTAQLVTSLNAVATAAATGNASAVQAALRELQQVRDNTLQVLREDLLAIFHGIDALRIESAVRVIGDLSSTIQIAGQDTVQFFGELRTVIAEIEANLDFNAQDLLAMIDPLLDRAEQMAIQVLVDPIDQRVEELKAWVRSLLNRLPLRELRNELSQYILQAAQAIQNADLDQYSRQLLGLIDQLQTAVSSVNITNDVRDALQKAEQTLTHALDSVLSALDTIKTEIERLAASAQQILDKLVQALHEFHELINRITDAIQNLGIEAAAQQVIDTLAELRQKGEDLLSNVPLPEPMRPLIEQLISTLEGIDLDATLGQPIRSVSDQLKIPPAVKENITQALAKADEIVSNLIPAAMIQELEAEIRAGLEKLRNFQPGSLLSGVTGFITDAATFLDNLDPTQAVAELRQPFQAILDAIDQLSPFRLLSPIIDVYNDLLGNLPLPDPQTGARRFTDVINTAGNAVTQTVNAPLNQLGQSAGGSTPTAGNSTPPAGGAAGGLLPNDITDLRPGDAIRLLGYLPAKLRDAIQALGAGPAGDVLRLIDSMIGGLARDLRRVQAVLWAVDKRLETDLATMLSPLSTAQLGAQLALQANFSASAGGSSASLDLSGALTVVATIDPGAIQLALTDTLNTTRNRVQRAAALDGHSSSLARLADALERVHLGSLLTDLDGFLAALDPEPIAADLDRLMLAMLKKIPQVFGAVRTELESIVQRLKSLVERFNPGRLAHRFLDVLSVLREEMSLLDPTRLAIELNDIHAAIKAAIMAYDPAIFAEALRAPIAAVAQQLRALNPTELLGDLSFLDPIIARIESALPSQALAGVGSSLHEVGQALIDLNPGELLDSVNALPERIVSAFMEVLAKIKEEIVRLLESLRYAAGSASASVSVSASVGVG